MAVYGWQISRIRLNVYHFRRTDRYCGTRLDRFSEIFSEGLNYGNPLENKWEELTREYTPGIFSNFESRFSNHRAAIKFPLLNYVPSYIAYLESSISSEQAILWYYFLLTLERWYFFPKIVIRYRAEKLRANLSASLPTRLSTRYRPAPKEGFRVGRTFFVAVRMSRIVGLVVRISGTAVRTNPFGYPRGSRVGTMARRSSLASIPGFSLPWWTTTSATRTDNSVASDTEPLVTLTQPLALWVLNINDISRNPWQVDGRERRWNAKTVALSGMTSGIGYIWALLLLPAPEIVEDSNWSSGFARNIKYKLGLGLSLKGVSYGWTVLES